MPDLVFRGHQGLTSGMLPETAAPARHPVPVPARAFGRANHLISRQVRADTGYLFALGGGLELRKCLFALGGGLELRKWPVWRHRGGAVRTLTPEEVEARIEAHARGES